jgi:hypothetical protein
VPETASAIAASEVFAVSCFAAVAAPVGSGSETALTGCVCAEPSTGSALPEIAFPFTFLMSTFGEGSGCARAQSDTARTARTAPSARRCGVTS